MPKKKPKGMKFKEDVKLDPSQVEDRRVDDPARMPLRFGPSGYSAPSEKMLRERVGRRKNDPTMLSLLTSDVIPELYEQVQRKPKRKK